MALLSWLGWVESARPTAATGGLGVNEPDQVGPEGQAEVAEPAPEGERLDAFRQTERQRLGEPVSASGVAWENETLHYEEDEVQTVEQERVLCDLWQVRL